MKYQELGYTLPPVTAQVAARKAIEVLEKIADVDASCLFYVLQPSNILALAGLRAQSPYNEFEPTFSQEKRAKLGTVLHDSGYELMHERYPYHTGTRNFFSVMCNQAFRELPSTYTSIKPFWKPPLKPGDFTDYYYWSENCEISLVNQMETDKLPKDWLLDWWAPHNIRFGMLLGYPGQAISSSCWDQARRHKGEPVEPELAPSIPFQGLYCGTHVDYDYTAGLSNDPTLKAHEALWSDVLREVYGAFPEARTLKLKNFKAEYDRYNKYDEAV